MAMAVQSVLGSVNMLWRSWVLVTIVAATWQCVLKFQQTFWGWQQRFDTVAFFFRVVVAAMPKNNIWRLVIIFSVEGSSEGGGEEGPIFLPNSLDYKSSSSFWPFWAYSRRVWWEWCVLWLDAWRPKGAIEKRRVMRQAEKSARHCLHTVANPWHFCLSSLQNSWYCVWLAIHGRHTVNVNMIMV